jgi:capsular exopolysaccharide synthesis family protein
MAEDFDLPVLASGRGGNGASPNGYHPAPSPSDTPAGPSDISLRDYLDLLRRRKAIVIQTFVVVFLVGLVVTMLAKPLFRTGGRLLVEGKTTSIAQVNTADPLSSIMPHSGHDVATQIEVMTGQRVLQEAYSEANVPARAARVDVKQVEQTDVIEYEVESTNAGMAERLARQLPETYKKYVSGSNKTEITTALGFAKNRYEAEKETLEKLEGDMLKFKKRTQTANLQTEREGRIGQMIAAEQSVRQTEADMKSASARLAALQTAKANVKEFEDQPTTTTNPRIEIVKADIAKLEQQRASLLPLFKPNHPSVKIVDDQLAELKRQLAALPPTLVTKTTTRKIATMQNYEDRVNDAKAQLASATAAHTSAVAKLAQSKTGLQKYAGLEREQDRLMREIALKRERVIALSKSVDDLALRESAASEPVKIITPAPDAIQVAPKKVNNLIYAAIVGLVLGLCLALLQEFLDDRINAPEEARRLLGVPVLGYVPLVEKEDGRLLSRVGADGLLRGGGSLLESYRVLRSNVQFAAVDAPVNSLLITSTAPGEGKSVTACNLAVALAMDGKNVILVDADLRRPTVHEKFGLAPGPGLTNVLVGQMSVEEALQDTPVPSLKVLTAGPPPPNPAELLNSHAMDVIHQELKDRCDIVIFDSPPSLATADAQVLSASVDGVIYVVQFGEAKKSAVRHAGELLRQARARVLGVVFNKIDLSGNRDDYYYGYYRYYNYYETPQLPSGTGRTSTSRTNGGGKSNGNGKSSGKAVVKVPAKPNASTAADTDKKES